jgi:hypothetical protein
MSIQLTAHQAGGDPLNAGLTLQATDTPGSGGAYHQYEIAWRDYNGNRHACRIHFQEGGVREPRSPVTGAPLNGVNGPSGEALLAIVQHRLQCFQAGPFACAANATALQHVTEALMALHARSQDRLARGVEGVAQV